MARLPQVGGDVGNWGTVLNDYLSESHNTDGTLKNNIVGASQLQDGAVGTFAIADSAVVEAKLSSAVQAKLNTAGSGGVGDDTITTAKLNDGAVTNAKISASAAIAQSKIANLTTDLASKADTTHTHAINEVTSLQTTLSGKANTSHSHAIGDVTDLQTTLTGKANATHAHAIADITSLSTTLSGKANTTHSHAVADITGLQTTLTGKADTAHTHAAGDINTGTIAAARLPAATATSVGAVELATTAEAVAGTDTTRAVTPAGLASAVSSIPGGTSPWDYGIFPRVVWTGTAWPTRSSALPSGYTGSVEYWSAADTDATPPSDRVVGDIWTRVGTV